MGPSFSWWCLDFFFFFLFAWLVQRLSLSLPILSSSASWKKRELGRILLLFSDLGFPIGGLCTLFDDERGNSTGFCLVLLRLFGSLYDGTVRGSEKGFWAGWDMFLIFGIG